MLAGKMLESPELRERRCNFLSPGNCVCLLNSFAVNITEGIFLVNSTALYHGVKIDKKGKEFYFRKYGF